MMSEQQRYEVTNLKENSRKGKLVRPKEGNAKLKTAGTSSSLQSSKILNNSLHTSPGDLTEAKFAQAISSASKTQNGHKSSEVDTKKTVGYADQNLSTKGEVSLRFLDIPKTTTAGAETDWSVLLCKNVQKLSPEDILAKSCEKTYDKVYAIELNGQRLEKIENLEKFRALRVLDLSSNFIRRIENLGSNRELRELKLYGNAIGAIENLDGLKDLQNLHLQHNHIKTIGNGLKAVPKLKVLRLDFNQINRIATSELSACTCLTSLDLSFNQLENIDAVSCLSNLEELNASHNNLKSVADLSRCKRLEEIDISLNPLTDLSGLKRMSSLKIINASQSHMKSIVSLGSLPELEQLKLAQCRLTELKSISQNYPALQVLDISSNTISDIDELKHLSALKVLIELSISGNPFCQSPDPSSSSYANILRKHLPSLTILDSIPIDSITSVNVATADDVAPIRPQTASMLTPRKTLSITTLPYTPSIRPGTVMGIQLPEIPIDGAEDDGDAQFICVQAQLSAFEADLSAKFAELRACLIEVPSKLLSETAQNETNAEENVLGKSATSTKSKLKQRLLEAKEFSSTNFEKLS